MIKIIFIVTAVFCFFSVPVMAQTSTGRDSDKSVFVKRPSLFLNPYQMDADSNASLRFVEEDGETYQELSFTLAGGFELGGWGTEHAPLDLSVVLSNNDDEESVRIRNFLVGFWRNKHSDPFGISGEIGTAEHRNDDFDQTSGFGESTVVKLGALQFFGKTPLTHSFDFTYGLAGEAYVYGEIENPETGDTQYADSGYEAEAALGFQTGTKNSSFGCELFANKAEFDTNDNVRLTQYGGSCVATYSSTKGVFTVNLRSAAIEDQDGDESEPTRLGLQWNLPIQ